MSSAASRPARWSKAPSPPRPASRVRRISSPVANDATHLGAAERTRARVFVVVVAAHGAASLGGRQHPRGGDSGTEGLTGAASDARGTASEVGRSWEGSLNARRVDGHGRRLEGSVGAGHRGDCQVAADGWVWSVPKKQLWLARYHLPKASLGGRVGRRSYRHLLYLWRVDVHLVLSIDQSNAKEKRSNERRESATCV